MDADDKALVERLRGDWPEILVEKHWMMDSDAIDKQREEAADRIEALSAENERLREALDRLAEASSKTLTEMISRGNALETLEAENERLREALRRIRQKSCFNPFRTLPEASDSLYWCFCEANLALGDTE